MIGDARLDDAALGRVLGRWQAPAPAEGLAARIVAEAVRVDRPRLPPATPGRRRWARRGMWSGIVAFNLVLASAVAAAFGGGALDLGRLRIAAGSVIAHVLPHRTAIHHAPPPTSTRARIAAPAAVRAPAFVGERSPPPGFAGRGGLRPSLGRPSGWQGHVGQLSRARGPAARHLPARGVGSRPHRRSTLRDSRMHAGRSGWHASGRPRWQHAGPRQGASRPQRGAGFDDPRRRFGHGDGMVDDRQGRFGGGAARDWRPAGDRWGDYRPDRPQRGFGFDGPRRGFGRSDAWGERPGAYRRFDRFGGGPRGGRQGGGRGWRRR